MPRPFTQFPAAINESQLVILPTGKKKWSMSSGYTLTFQPAEREGCYELLFELDKKVWIARDRKVPLLRISRSGVSDMVVKLRRKAASGLKFRAVLMPGSRQFSITCHEELVRTQTDREREKKRLLRQRVNYRSYAFY